MVVGRSSLVVGQSKTVVGHRPSVFGQKPYARFEHRDYRVPQDPVLAGTPYSVAGSDINSVLSLWAKTEG